MNMLNASVYDQLVNPTPTISYYFLSWQQPASAIGQTEPSRAKLMHLSTFRHAEQMIDDLIRLGWRAEIAPPHI